MRADLAASLLHNPSILYLDEPTIGLDIAVKESMIGYIRKVNVERGVTVMLTSHDLKDVEGICRRIIVIDEGKLICDEQISRLTGRFAKERSLHVTLSHSDKAIKDELVKLPSISVETDDNINFTINFPKDDYTAFEIISIIARSTSISDFKLVEPDIKKVIEKIYRSELVLEDTQ
jgi:ABC-2 type transport system ATP-binding protein